VKAEYKPHRLPEPFTAFQRVTGFQTKHPARLFNHDCEPSVELVEDARNLGLLDLDPQ
jgi:hypothetical protein